MEISVDKQGKRINKTVGMRFGIVMDFRKVGEGEKGHSKELYTCALIGMDMHQFFINRVVVREFVTLVESEEAL